MALGGLSGLLYVVVHLTQQSLFGGTPGLAGNNVVPWADPASHPRLVALLSVYAAAVLGLLALYASAIRVSHVASLSRRAVWLALLLPVPAYLGFLFCSPYFSTDVYSYTAYGYIGALPDGNPYYQEGRTIAGSQFGMQLASLGWRGSGLSPYGPTWNDLEIAVVRLTPDASRAVLLTKTLVVAATLGSAALVFSILRSVHPSLRVSGTVGVLWNPLLVLLLAGEGHNDAFVMLLVLAALAPSVRRHVAGGLVLQLAAVVTKYLPIVLLPIQLAFWWRTEMNRSRLGLQCALGVLVGLTAAVLLYQPVWVGPDTFIGTGVLGSGSSSGTSISLLATAELVARYAVVGVAVLVGAWRARDATCLLSSCAGVVLVVVLAGPQKFLPWYAAVPVALMALTPSRTFLWTGLVLAACSLLASPVEELPLSPQSLISPEAQAVVFHVTRVLPLLTFLGLSSAGVLSHMRGSGDRFQLAF